MFATSGELGVTLSRSFTGQMPGVMGADLAEIDLARFLRDRHIGTPSSTVASYHFTEDGRGNRRAAWTPRRFTQSGAVLF